MISCEKFIRIIKSNNLEKNPCRQMFLYFRQPPLRIFVKLIPCCLKFVNYLKPCLYVQMKCVRKTCLAACAKNLLEKYRIPTCLKGVTLTTERLCNAGDRYCKLIYHSQTWIVVILLESQESHAKMDQKSNLCEVWMIKTLWTSVVRQYLFYAPSEYCHSIFLSPMARGISWFQYPSGA